MTTLNTLMKLIIPSKIRCKDDAYKERKKIREDLLLMLKCMVTTSNTTRLLKHYNTKFQRKNIKDIYKLIDEVNKIGDRMDIHYKEKERKIIKESLDKFIKIILEINNTVRDAVEDPRSSKEGQGKLLYLTEEKDDTYVNKMEELIEHIKESTKHYQ